MQIHRIQNNNHNTNFGATLKINNRCGKLKNNVIEFLEKQFPKRTENINGNINVVLNNEKEYPDLLIFSNKEYKDCIEINFYAEEQKETLLEGLVNSLNGFIIREKAQNKIDALKNKILEVSDKAYRESAYEFKKTFPVWDGSLIKHDIAPEESPFVTIIFRNTSIM